MYEKELRESALRGKLTKVQQLLKKKDIQVNEVDSESFPFGNALILAAYCGHDKIVEVLLKDHRVNINETNKCGQSSFYFACLNGHHEIVKMMLKFKTLEVNKATFDMWTPFYAACWRQHFGIVKELLKDGRIDININDKKEENSLMNAVYLGNQSIVEWILASGRDVEIHMRNRNGKRILDIAKETNNKEVYELLKDFEDNPFKVRRNLRLKLGLTGTTIIHY